MASIYVDDGTGNKLMSELIASGFVNGDTVYITGGNASDYRTLTIDVDCRINILGIGTTSTSLQTTNYCKVIINDGVTLEINTIYLSAHSIFECSGTKNVVTESSPGVYPIGDNIYAVEVETAPGSGDFEWFFVLDNYNPETISYSKNTSIPVLLDSTIKKKPIGGIVGRDGVGKKIAPYTVDLYYTTLSRTMFNLNYSLPCCRTFYYGNSAYMPNLMPDPGCYYMGMQRYKNWSNGISELSDSVDWTIGLNGDIHTYKDFKTFTLAANISSSDTSLTVNEDISSLPSEGFICIDDELIRYTSKNDSTKTFSGLVRGEHITEAAAHSAGAIVNEGGFVYYIEVKNNMCWRSGSAGSYVLNFGQTGPQPNEGGWRYLQAVPTGCKIRHNKTKLVAISTYAYFYIGGTLNLTNVDFTCTSLSYRWIFNFEHRSTGEVSDIPGILESCSFSSFSAGNVGAVTRIYFSTLNNYANQLVTFSNCYLNLTSSFATYRPIKFTNSVFTGSASFVIGYTTLFEGNNVIHSNYPAPFLGDCANNSNLFVRTGSSIGSTTMDGFKQGTGSQIVLVTGDTYFSGSLIENLKFLGTLINFSSNKVFECTVSADAAGEFYSHAIWTINSKVKFYIRNDGLNKPTNLFNSTKKFYSTSTGIYSPSPMLEVQYHSSSIESFLPHQPNFSAEFLTAPYSGVGVRIVFNYDAYSGDFIENCRMYNFNLFNTYIHSSNSLMDSAGCFLVLNNKTTVTYKPGASNNLVTTGGRFIVYADDFSVPVSLYKGVLISSGAVSKYVNNTQVLSVVSTNRSYPAYDVSNFGVLFFVPVTAAGSLIFEFNVLYSANLDAGNVTYYLNVTGPGCDEKESNIVSVPAGSSYLVQKNITVNGPGIVTIELKTDGNSLVEDLKCYGDIIESPTNEVSNIRFADPLSGGIILNDSNYVAPNGVGTIVAYGFMW